MKVGWTTALQLGEGRAEHGTQGRSVVTQICASVLFLILRYDWHMKPCGVNVHDTVSVEINMSP